MTEEEAIYILTNPCLEGLVKIGRTSAARLIMRINELSRVTSIPLPFECEYAAIVENALFVEQRLHEAFGDHRVSLKKEFFKISPHRVKAILVMVAVREITPDNESEEANEVKSYVERRPPFRFSLANIPVGAVLQFVDDENVTCKVIDDRSVEFQGAQTSLSAAAVELLRTSRAGRKSSQVQGPLYWLYNGETLDERRQRVAAES